MKMSLGINGGHIRGHICLQLTPQQLKEIQAVKEAIKAAAPGKYRRSLKTRLADLKSGKIQVPAHQEL